MREKVAAKPFQGSGNVLGSIAPSVAPPTADASMDPKQVIRKILLNHILRNDEEKWYPQLELGQHWGKKS